MSYANNTTWWVIGNGPSRKAGMGVLSLLHRRGNQVIAANSDCADIPAALDYYFLADAVACRKFAAAAKTLGDNGARLVTLHRDARALFERGVQDFDIFLRVASAPVPIYSRGAQTDISYSGLHCLQFALNMGATTIHLVGMDGYGADDAGTQKIIGPFTQSCIDACRDVRFVFHGPSKPTYAVAGANVNFWNVPHDP